jgi:predicted DNA-binding transcriptional regulator YafY
MSASSSQTTIARHWELLKLLPSHGPGVESKVLTQQLADAGFQVSKRTVERDLQELSAIFPIQCNDKSIPYGWHWLAGAGLHFSALSVTEALSLALVESQVRQLLPAPLLSSLNPLFAQANQKLNALKQSVASTGFPDKFVSVTPAMPLLPPAVDEQVLRQLQQALLDEKQLDVRYHSLHNNSTKCYRLNPLAMVQRGPVCYLIATAAGHKEPRRFAVHRFLQVVQTDDPIQKPETFILQQYLADGAMAFSDGQTVYLELEVEPLLANLLAETPLSHDMRLELQHNGNTYIAATVHKGWQLNHWLLAHANALTVIAPIELRDMVKQKLTAALSRY